MSYDIIKEKGATEMNGIKRIISLILITAMTVIPVYAEEVNEEYIPYQEEYSY